MPVASVHPPEADTQPPLILLCRTLSVFLTQEEKSIEVAGDFGTSAGGGHSATFDTTM